MYVCIDYVCLNIDYIRMYIDHVRCMCIDYVCVYIDYTIQTALMIAAAKGRLRAVSLLIQAKTNIEARDENGQV